MIMGFYDEALESLSEALRLSQTYSDEESINQCLIYLYQIAFYKGHLNEVELIIYDWFISSNSC
jgi:hypothetical protein